MELPYVKAIHIVFVVSWFAALFYIIRLFIYATEAQAREGNVKEALTDQLLLMQRRLWYIIGWPAMIGTFIFGWWMIWLAPGYLTMPWMQLKLLVVLFLLIYHLYCEKILRDQQQGRFKISSFKLRLINELATVLLVSIVFLAVVKSTAGLAWGVGGLFIFALTLMTAVFLYKRLRGRNQKDKP